MMNSKQAPGYKFEWKDLGNLEVGRPNLGPMTNVAVYRLMQYTLRNVLIDEYGAAKTAELLKEAGRMAGHEFCINMLDRTLGFNEFAANLKETLLKLNIGILQIEKSDLENMNFVMTVSEDLDCSGIPIAGDSECDYDAGFIEGIFLAYTGKFFLAREIDCWASGERTCRFTVELINT